MWESPSSAAASCVVDYQYVGSVDYVGSVIRFVVGVLLRGYVCGEGVETVDGACTGLS